MFQNRNNIGDMLVLAAPTFLLKIPDLLQLSVGVRNCCLHDLEAALILLLYLHV